MTILQIPLNHGCLEDLLEFAWEAKPKHYKVQWQYKIKVKTVTKVIVKQNATNYEVFLGQTEFAASVQFEVV